VDTQDDNKSLLRRLLGQDQEPHAPEDADAPESSARPSPPPLPDPQENIPTSPIRPSVPDDSRPQELLAPSVYRTPTDQLTPREQMQRAEEALINLREKMAQIAAEFAQGKINRAQFDAIYGRYSEQRVITERLLARNPETQAWQSVVQPGHTTFLKQHFEAHIISYAIYDQETSALIALTGMIQLEVAQVQAVLRRLRAIRQQRGVNPGPAQRKISDGKVVLFVPGDITISVVIYSREPSTAQLKRVQDLHQDFERANHRALQSHDYTDERLVFPHRALFERL
jgi:hypothetical protein